MEVKKQSQMSGTEPGIMSGRESYSVTLQKNQVPSQPSANMRLAYGPDGTAVYKPITGTSPSYPVSGGTTGSGGGGGGEGPIATTVQHSVNSHMGEPMKRKRGRPRKYGPDGTMALAVTPVSPPVPPSGGSGSIGSGGFPPATSPPSSKKARGRPPGSGKKHQLAALGSAGIGFTPHVITVKAGEEACEFVPSDSQRATFSCWASLDCCFNGSFFKKDCVEEHVKVPPMLRIKNNCFKQLDVSSKIMSFSQHGSRAVCILSANGAISNVTLRQAATSGGTVTFEGRFEILSLSGSFLLSESGGQRSRTGGLSVLLAGPDGRVLGGGVAGLLTAASPVQIVVGSFIADGHKESKPKSHSDPSVQPKLAPGVGAGTSSPPSRGTLSESSGGPGSPLNQSTGACNNNTPQGMANMPWK